MAGTGNKGGRRKLPTAAAQAIPTAPAASPAAMTPAEAAPALEAAHDAADIAAAPLLTAAAPLLTAADTLPAAITPAALAPSNPDSDPGTAHTALPATATEDKTMDVNATIENTAEKTTAQGQAMFADLSDRTRGAVEKGQRFFAELAEFNKGNIEALVESSKIAARGFESWGQDVAAEAKTSFEGASQAVQTLATAKSPTEFLKLQADYARSAFDTMVQQASRRTEASLKLAGEIAQPISNRVALAAEKVKVAA